jgi:putative DNA primase/helicase
MTPLPVGEEYTADVANVTAAANHAARAGDLSDLATQMAGQMRLHETPTDTGNAYRFARLVGNQVRYVPAEDTWLVWDGTRLRRDDLNETLHLTLNVCADVRRHVASVPEDDRRQWSQWADATESAARRTSMLRLASSLPQLAVGAETLDTQQHLLNCANGTLDLRPGGELYTPKLDDQITHKTLASYDPHLAWTPLLQEYVATFMPDPEQWSYLMKVLGSTLYGGNAFRLWLVVYGRTTSGKGQLIETISKLLGDYAVPVPTSVFRANQDDKPRPDLLRALSARFVYAEEGSQEWELHGDHVKRLTGGDPIVARGMRSNVMVERTPAFTPLIVCNSFPRVKDADSGVRRRLRALTFAHSVEGRELADKREQFMNDDATLTALLTQLVDGCRRAYTEGVSDMPQAWVEGTLAAFDALSHAGEFVRHLYEEGQLVDRDDVPLTQCWQAKELHLAYQMWLNLYGGADDLRQRLSLKQLNDQLREMGWRSGVSGGTRWLNKAKPVNEHAI